MVWEKQESELGFWNPKVGEELIGEVMEITIEQYGKQITLKDSAGHLIKTSSHKVLQAKLNKVIVGDKVRIVYLKEELPRLKGQNGTKIYEVYVDKIKEEAVK